MAKKKKLRLLLLKLLLRLPLLKLLLPLLLLPLTLLLLPLRLLTLLLLRLLLLPPSNLWQAAQKTGLRAGFFRLYILPTHDSFSTPVSSYTASGSTTESN